jgi:hypothetical protein
MDVLPPPLPFFPSVLGLDQPPATGGLEYLLEENRVLRAERGSRRLCLTDDQRRRLAVKGGPLGRCRIATSRASSPRNDPPLVPPARRPEVRRLQETSPRSPQHQPGHRRAGAPVVRLATEHPT